MFADKGDRPFAVHEYRGLRIGMHICYDGGFPETGRVLALLRAALLVRPTNRPARTEAIAEHPTACHFPVQAGEDLARERAAIDQPGHEAAGGLPRVAGSSA